MISWVFFATMKSAKALPPLALTLGHLAVLAMGSRSCAFGASACELLSRRSVVLWLAPIPLTSHALQPLACEQRAAKGVA